MEALVFWDFIGARNVGIPVPLICNFTTNSYGVKHVDHTRQSHGYHKLLRVYVQKSISKKFESLSMSAMLCSISQELHL